MPEPEHITPAASRADAQAPLADDPRLAFVYQEALRGLLQQQAAVESLHNRAATLVFAASFASSLLGGRALADGLGGFWEWTGVVLLLAIGVLTVFLLWPYYNLSFRFDAGELLEDYVDTPTPQTMSGMHRALALRIKDDWHNNGKIVRRLREAFQLALVLLVVEILVWMFAIAAEAG
jgi:hypothetical protein